MRIVSLIPEATEILAALGLGSAVTSAAPEEALAGDLLWSPRPDLIFTSEALGPLPRREVKRLLARHAQKPRPAVYALEPRSLGEILSDVKTVGDATGAQHAARALIERLRERIDAVSLRTARALAEHGLVRVVCLVSEQPPIAAGWWQAELIGLAGGLDLLDGVGRAPRAVTWQEIDAARPALIVTLASGRSSLLPLGGLPSPTGLSSPPTSDGRALHPGPAAIDVLERLAALLHPPMAWPPLRRMQRR